MKPRRTPSSNHVFRLAGGNEDNDLWVNVQEDSDGDTFITSTWELTEDEREAIAAGANLKLIVWGTGHPPVALQVSKERLGRGEL